MLAAPTTPSERARDGPQCAAIDSRAATEARAAEMDDSDREPLVAVDEVEAAFLRHAQALLGYLYVQTGRVQDAEDLLGDVFVQACRYRGRIAQIDHWLFTVARHAAGRLLGRRGREISMEDVPDGGATGGPPDAVAEPERSGFDPAAPEIIALRALKETDQEILMLHGQAKRPIPEVASILEISEDAAWQRWQRARDRYSAQLVAVGVHPPEGWRKPRRANTDDTNPPAADADPAGPKDGQHDMQ